MNISVAICTHNGANFIADQLFSILSQTLLPVEIIVSDDNSTDNTVEIVESIFSSYIQMNNSINEISFQIFKNQKALGVSKNFELVLGLCSSELIALADQDDIWEPNKLEIMSKYFEEDQTLTLMHTDSLLVNQFDNSLKMTAFEALRISKNELSLINNGQALNVYIVRNLATGASMMIRRSLLDYALPIPTNWLHDEWLAISAALFGSVRILPQRLIRYRQHDHNLVGLGRLGLRHQIGRVIFPGTERNCILLSRAEELFDFSITQKLSGEKLNIVRGKLLHESNRSNLPSSRIYRIFPITREILSGRYKRFGLGFLDVVRDLFQPL